MKKKFYIIPIVLLFAAFIGYWAFCGLGTCCANNTKNESAGESSVVKNQKILVAYFSHSGNTRVIAEYIKNATGGDIFEIIPVTPYSDDYDTVVEQAKVELKSKIKPTIKAKVENVKEYDIIFVGYPNWWNTIPGPVRTFLSEHNLESKTIAPFCTHGGSELGESVDDIKEICPKSKVLDGLAIFGKDVKNAQSDVLEWLKQLKIN